MPTLTCPIAIKPDLYRSATATALERHLVAPWEAKDGDIVALCRDYRNTLSGVYRDEAPTFFVVRQGSALKLWPYSRLKASQQAAMAHTEMLLQEDETYRSVLCDQIYDLEDDSEDTDTHSIVCLPSAIGVIKFSMDRGCEISSIWETDRWTQKCLDETVRLVLAQAASAHDAFDRSASVLVASRYWRCLLGLRADDADLPDFEPVNVELLLKPTR